MSKAAPLCGHQQVAAQDGKHFTVSLEKGQSPQMTLMSADREISHESTRKHESVKFSNVCSCAFAKFAAKLFLICTYRRRHTGKWQALQSPVPKIGCCFRCAPRHRATRSRIRSM